MTIITTKTDIEVWVDNCRGDLDAGERARLVDAIQDADHPRWGSDWQEWLDERVEPLVLEIAGAGCEADEADEDAEANVSGGG
jgi:hypothetical protein